MKLTKTETTVLKMMEAGKSLAEISLAISKPIPITGQIIQSVITKVKGNK